MKEELIVSIILILLFINVVSAGIGCTATINQQSDGAINVYGSNTWADFTCINATLDNSSAVVNNGTKEWILKVPLIMNTTSTTLYINSTDTITLKLDNATSISNLTIFGIPEWDGIKITSWDSTTNLEISSNVVRPFINILGTTTGGNITNSNLSNLGYSTYSNYGVFALQRYGLNINNSTFLNNFIGVYIFNSNVTFVNNTISNSYSQNLEIRADGTLKYVSTVSDSTFNNSVSHGIWIRENINGTLNFTSNNIFNSGGIGIRITNLSDSIFTNILVNNSGVTSSNGGININGPSTNNLTFTNVTSTYSNNSNIGLLNVSNSIFEDITANWSKSDDAFTLSYGGTYGNIIKNSSLSSTSWFLNYFSYGAYNNTLTNISYYYYPTDDSLLGINSDRTNNMNLKVAKIGVSTQSGNNYIVDPVLLQGNTIFVEVIHSENGPALPLGPTNISIILSNNKMISDKAWTGESYYNFISYPTNTTLFLRQPYNANESEWWKRVHNVTILNATIIPSTDSIVVNITIWNTTYKKFNESSDNTSLTSSYIIGDLSVNQNNEVQIYWSNGTKFQGFYAKSNDTGYIIYSTAGFEYPRYTVITSLGNDGSYNAIVITVTALLGGAYVILRKIRRS